jgi:hypothetical protein
MQVCMMAFSRVFLYRLTTMGSPIKKQPKFKKVRWRHIIRNWQTSPEAKLVAFSILSRSAPDGWAGVSLKEIRSDTRLTDNRKIKPAIALLFEQGKLQHGHSDKKSKMVMRLFP